MKKKICKDVNWEKAIICGVTLGWMTSVIYLLLMIAVAVTI